MYVRSNMTAICNTRLLPIWFCFAETEKRGQSDSYDDLLPILNRTAIMADGHNNNYMRAIH